MDQGTPAPPLPPIWPCEGCGYNVHGTRDAVCPECGRAFDASEFTPERLARRRRPPRKWVAPVLIALQFAPIALALLCYVGGRVALGRWPRISLDDPKGISGIAPLYTAWLLSGVVLIPILPFIHAARWIIAPYDSPARRDLAWWAIGGIAAWPLCLVGYGMIADHTEVLVWLRD